MLNPVIKVLSTSPNFCVFKLKARLSVLPLPHNPTPTKRSGTKNAVFLLLPGGPKHASLQAPAEAHTATTPTLASEGHLHRSHHSTDVRVIALLKC